MGKQYDAYELVADAIEDIKGFMDTLESMLWETRETVSILESVKDELDEVVDQDADK